MRRFVVALAVCVLGAVLASWVSDTIDLAERSTFIQPVGAAERDRAAGAQTRRRSADAGDENLRSQLDANRRIFAISPTAAQANTYLRHQRQEAARRAAARNAPGHAARVAAAQAEAKARREKAQREREAGEAHQRALELEVVKAQAQAAANAQQKQNQTSQPYYQRPPWAYYPPNPGPFWENVSTSGNQTYINGFGPYGPFYETIDRTGGQAYIYGSGVPPYVGFGPGY